MGAFTKAPLVGRTTILDVLRRTAAAAAEGTPAGVVLEGEAGIGKTRLVTELADEVTAADGTVLIGHCSPAAGRHLAFGPWLEVLRDLVDQVGRARVLELAGARAPVLSQLQPDLASTDGSLEPTTPTPGRVFEAVTALLQGVAAPRTTMIGIEDVHWSDATSRDLLDHLLRVVRRERLLVIVTARSDEPGAEDVHTFLTELTRLPHVVRLGVPRLVRAEVIEQISQLREVAPSRSESDRVMAVSEGVPFLVEEAVAAAVGVRTSTRTFARALVGHRLAPLDADGQALVDAAAVGQDPLLIDRLARASGLTGGHFDGALRQAIGSGVLEVSDDDSRVCRFRHALLREAARERLLPGRRRELNRRWAQTLATSERPVPAGHAAALAAHWTAADDPAPALEACLAAAAEAERVAAYAERAQWLEQATCLWPRVTDASSRTGRDSVDLLAEAGEAMFLAGNPGRAEVLVDAALDELDPHVGRPSLGGWLKVIRAWIADANERPVPLSEVVAIVETIPTRPPSRERAKAALWLAQRLMQSGRPDEGLPYVDEAVRSTAALPDPGPRVDAMMTRALVLSGLGRNTEAVAAVATVRRMAEDLELRWRSGVEMASAVVSWTVGDADGGIAASRRGVELTGGERPGALPAEWGMHSLNVAEGLLDAGEWDEAEQILLRVLDVPGMSLSITGWADRLGWQLRAWRGELSEDEWGHRGREGPAWRGLDDGEIQNILPPQTTRADVAAFTGRVEAVRDAVRPVLAEPRCATLPAFLWPLLEVAARTEADVRRAGLEPSSEVVAAVARVSGSMPPQNSRDAAFAANVAAELARCADESDVDRWRSVVDGWRTLGFPHRAGWASVRLAEAAGSRDGGQAQEALIEATSVAETLRARPLAEAARDLAHRLHITLPTSSVTTALPTAGSLGLSARELEVLTLVAEGDSNQMIADKLFISRKTASVHVSHVLAKLGVSTRTRAAAIAYRAGIAGNEAGPTLPRQVSAPDAP